MTTEVPACENSAQRMSSFVRGRHPEAMASAPPRSIGDAAEGPRGTIARLRLAHDELPSPSPVDEPAAFFRRYAPYVARIIIRLHAVDDDLEDLVHDVFVAAFRQAEQLREPEAARGWLGTITVRSVRRRLHQRRIRRWIGLEADSPIQIEDKGATPEDRLQLIEIHRLLEQVAVVDAVAWKLRYFGGEPLEEVARQCECSLATVKRRIARASAHLEVNFGG